MRTSAALALAVFALAGCGGDDEPAESTLTAPELTVPGADDTQAPEATATVPTEPESTTPPADTGGGTAVPDLPQSDSPGNDVPPETDSPEERFEEFCDANPGACG